MKTLVRSLTLWSLVLLWAAPCLGQVERRSFQSEALKEVRYYHLYLPPGYEADTTRRYPVLVLLHGLGGSDADWFTLGRVAENLDRLIAAKQIAPLIVVAPDGGNGYWVNHVSRRGVWAPRYGDFVSKDLVVELEAKWRTDSSWAIAGLSMGGFGAMSIGLRHPKRFRAVASLSGALFPKAPTHRKVYARAWGNPPRASHWRKISAMTLLERLRPASAPALYLHCGDDDGLGFLEYTLQAHRRLVSQGVAHELRVHNGPHSWDVWAAAVPDMLRFVDGALRAEVVPPTKAECDEGCSNLTKIMVHEAELLTRKDPELQGGQSRTIALNMVKSLAERTKSECMQQCEKKGSRQLVKCLAKAKSSAQIELCR